LADTTASNSSYGAQPPLHFHHDPRLLG